MTSSMVGRKRKALNPSSSPPPPPIQTFKSASPRFLPGHNTFHRMRDKDLLSLCMEAITTQIINGDSHHLQNIFELPPDLIDCLIERLPPLGLKKFQEQMSIKHCVNSTIDSVKDGRKRGRYCDFNTAWKTLFKLRWPEGVQPTLPMNQLTKQSIPRIEVASRSGDWQQMYWEAHLQNCLDKAAEAALLPSFDGCIGDIIIPDTIIKPIVYKGYLCDTTCAYTKLSYHCQQFGCYARCLRLHNVICVAETCIYYLAHFARVYPFASIVEEVMRFYAESQTSLWCDLLSGIKLQCLVLRGIKSEEHVNGVCKLLKQNNETLSAIDFIHCKFPSTSINAICNSLCASGTQTHGIQYFSIKASSVLESNLVSLPSGFLSFLSTGSSLRLLSFCDNHLGPSFAKAVFDTLLDASSGLSVLDLSDNNISGWLSSAKGRFSSCFKSSLGTTKSLSSLRALNLRGNNLRKDGIDGLRYFLLQMPKLESLDLSDNPIEDDGIRNLIPYIFMASERVTPLLDLKIDSCELSSNGVTELLRSISTLKKPLKTLSIADNDLGRQVAAPLANFLGASWVRELNIEDIGLGSSGFLKLREELPKELKLASINISKNRGGIETANFIVQLILRAPDLVKVNAGYNFMPSESLDVLCSALISSKGKLEQLDLTGNTGCYQPDHDSMLTISKLQFRGRPVMILPTLPFLPAPYDDDP